MNDDRLEAGVRELFLAAQWMTEELSPGNAKAARARLREAVDAYRKATARPEPFEAYLHGADCLDSDIDWYIDRSSTPDSEGDVVYRCTITPVERVR